MSAAASPRPLPDEIRHLGHQRERRPDLPVPAGLRALGDDHVRPAIERVRGIAPGLHLADQGGAGLLDPRGKRRRIAEREENRFRPPLEHEIQKFRLPRKRPGDEPAAERRRADLRQLLGEPRPVAVAAADEAEPAALGHSRRQTPAGGKRHGR
jgi:hypothetical protein